MGNWFKSLGLFFADMYRHTVGQMTGVLSIILALVPVLFPAFFAGDKGLLHSKWTWEGAAAISFFFAAYSAWKEQHEARLEAERKYFDERPLLGFEAHSVVGPKAWAELPAPVTFTVHRLSGRVPTSIYFDPIPSKNGRFLLQFDLRPHIAAPGFDGVEFEVTEPAFPPLSAADRETTAPYRWKLLKQFLDDSPQELLTLDYVLQCHFMDGDVLREQSFVLTFDRQTFRFQAGTSAMRR